MARNGPQRIPGAIFDLFFGSGPYSGSDMEVNCGVLHTTEGPSLPDYNSGAVAPTVTGVPDMAAHRIVWHQHFDVDESARALVNAPGGVQTNLANAFQIELVGTCDPDNARLWDLGSHALRAGVDYLYWPDAPDWALAEVAWLVRWLSDNHGVPMRSGLTFKAYPGSYGTDNGVRMSFEEWTRFEGWCGHMHVPENLHGDPGAIDINRLLSLAAGNNPNEEDPVTPENEALLRRIVREEAASVTVRNANAEAWFWWLPYFLTGEVPQAAIDQNQGWVKLIPKVHGLLQELPPELLDQLRTAVAEAMAAVVHVDVNVRQGA